MLLIEHYSSKRYSPYLVFWLLWWNLRFIQCLYSTQPFSISVCHLNECIHIRTEMFHHRVKKITQKNWYSSAVTLPSVGTSGPNHVSEIPQYSVGSRAQVLFFYKTPTPFSLDSFVLKFWPRLMLFKWIFIYFWPQKLVYFLFSIGFCNVPIWFIAKWARVNRCILNSSFKIF